MLLRTGLVENELMTEGDRIRPPLRTPKAAAIAGILFAVLLMIVSWLLRLPVPRDPHGRSIWCRSAVRRNCLPVKLLHGRCFARYRLKRDTNGYPSSVRHVTPGCGSLSQANDLAKAAFDQPSGQQSKGLDHAQKPKGQAQNKTDAQFQALRS